MSDLDNLEREALAIDAELEGLNNPQVDLPQKASLNEAFRPAIMKFLRFVVGFVNEKIPFTSKHFNDQALEDIASSLIKVGDIEGIDLNKIIGDPNSRLGAWLTLAVSIGMPSFTFYMAVLEYKKQHQAVKNTADQAQPLQPQPAQES
jgi:hypothetical protein